MACFLQGFATYFPFNSTVLISHLLQTHPMIKHLLSMMLCCLLSFTAWTQSVSLDAVIEPSKEYLCAGKNVVLAYHTNGAFNADNKFTIQLVSNTSISLETKDSSGFLVGKIPASIEANLAGPFTPVYQIRIISSSPAVNSSSTSNYNIGILPVLTVSSAKIYTLQGAAASISLEGRPYLPLPMTFVSSENEIFEMTSVRNPGAYVAYMHPQKTGAFSFKSVQNACGVGKITGSVDIVSTPNILEYAGFGPKTFCKGGNVSFSVNTFGTWQNNNKFYIELKLNETKSYQLEATLKDNIVTAKLPDDIEVEKYYSARIYATSPETSSITVNSVLIRDVSSVELVSGSKTLNVGESAFMTMNVKGAFPMTITMSDGNKVVVNSFTSTAQYNKKVTGSETFKVSSFSNSCGTGVGTGQYTVTANASLMADKTTKTAYCHGDSLVVNFTSSPSLSVNSEISAHLRLGDVVSSNDLIVSGKVLSTGVALFMLPKTISADAQVFALALFTNSLPTKTFLERAAILRTIPSVGTISPSNIATTLAVQGSFSYVVNVKGGGPYNLTTSQGETQFSPSELLEGQIFGQTYINKNTAFNITSISNSCGISNIGSNTLNITVASPSVITLSAPFKNEAELCVGSSYTLNIGSSVSIPTGTKFYLNYLNESGVVVKSSVGEFVNNQLQWTVPDDASLPSTLILQVSSSVSNLIGDKLRVKIGKKPQYSGNSVVNYTLLSPGQATFNLLTSSPLNSVVTFADNAKFYGSSNITLTLAGNTTTTYRVKSISNTCGEITPSLTYNLKVITQKVFFNKSSEAQAQRYCEGQSVTFNYYVVSYTPTFKDEPKTYRLEMSSSISFLNRTVVKTGISEPQFSVVLPTSTTIGTNYIRLVQEQDTLIMTDSDVIVYGRVPNLKVTTSTGKTDFNLNYGESIQLKVDNPNATPFDGFWVDNNNYYTSILEFQYYKTFTPVRSGTYKLNTLYNECGTSDNGLTLNVTVNPKITWSASLANTTINACNGDSFLVNINAQGSENVSNKYSLIMNSGALQQTIFETTKTGPQMVTIPKSVDAGRYSLVLTAQSGTITSANTNTLVNLSTTPALVLTGTATLNPSQTAYLYLKPQVASINDAYLQTVSYELNDGTKGTVQYSAISPGAIPVTVTGTKSFTVTKVSNQCGVGVVSGSATITLNAGSDKTIETNNILVNKQVISKVCAGGNYVISYNTKGTFSTNAKFDVQISDKNGQNFKTVSSDIVSSTPNTLSFSVPFDLPAGSDYHVKVISSEANTASSSTTMPLTLSSIIKAEFDTTQYYFTTDKPVSLKVNLLGKIPFYVRLGETWTTAKVYTINTLPFEASVTPTTGTSYQIFEVANGECGLGTVGAKNMAKLAVITGIDDLQSLGVLVGPNPTSDYITITSDEPNVKAEIFDMMGQSVFDAELHAGKNQISLQNFTNGVYHLKVSKGNKSGTFKVIKF